MGHRDQHAALGAQHVAGFVEHDLYLPRVLAEPVTRARPLAASGSTSASRRTRPSAFDTTLWATTSTSPSRRSASRPAMICRQVVSGRDLRQPVDRRDAQRGCAHELLRSICRSIPLVCAAPPRAAGQLRLQRREILRRVDVQRQRRHVHDFVNDAGLRRDRGVALAAVGSERWGDRVRRGQQQCVRAGSVAVGNDQRRRRLERAWQSARRAVAGSSSGQSPGTSSARSRPDSTAQRIATAAASLCPSCSSSRTVAP